MLKNILKTSIPTPSYWDFGGGFFGQFQGVTF